MQLWNDISTQCLYSFAFTRNTLFTAGEKKSPQWLLPQYDLLISCTMLIILIMLISCTLITRVHQNINKLKKLGRCDRTMQNCKQLNCKKNTNTARRVSQNCWKSKTSATRPLGPLFILCQLCLLGHCGWCGWTLSSGQAGQAGLAD